MYDFDRIIDRRGKNSAKWDEHFIGKGDSELLPFWVADTDFSAPECVQQALLSCVQHNIYGYTTPPSGCAQAAADWQKRRHGFETQTDWAVFIAGIDAALAACVCAFTEPGDAVLIQTPVYAPFFETVEKNGRRVLENPMRLINGRYEPDFDDFARKAKEAKIWMFCNPQNPSARCFTRDELLRFAQICLENDVLIVSDEIHADIVFDKRHHIPIASLSPEICKRTITCTSAGKTFSVAGLAASVIFIADEKLRRHFEEEKERCCINTNILGLVAMEAAYRGGDYYADALVAYLQENRDFALDYIGREITGLSALKPEATFLMWIDCSGLGLPSEKLEGFFCSAGVRLSMGSTYREPTGQFVRLNFGCRRAVLQEGLSRIAEAVNGLKRV